MSEKWSGEERLIAFCTTVVTAGAVAVMTQAVGCEQRQRALGYRNGAIELIMRSEADPEARRTAVELLEGSE